MIRWLKAARDSYRDIQRLEQQNGQLREQLVLAHSHLRDYDRRLAAALVERAELHAVLERLTIAAVAA